MLSITAFVKQQTVMFRSKNDPTMTLVKPDPTFYKKDKLYFMNDV